MKVLLLSPYSESLIDTLKNSNDSWIISTDSIDVDFLKLNSIDFIISYGYRKIIKSDIISFMGESIINLHISYLPFNRGSHPNLWCHIENTQCGVSIHIIDEGIDTGKILLRRKIFLNFKEHTFRSSYEILKKEIENLFDQNWKDIRTNKIKGFYPKEKGTYHNRYEGLELISRLENEWDTNIFKAINILRN